MTGNQAAKDSVSAAPMADAGAPHNYVEWNRVLVDHFFRPSRRSRPVRLTIDEDTLKALGGETDDLALAALEAAESHGCSNIQNLGRKLCAPWKRAATQALDESGVVPPPPFVAVLTLYVLAVNHGRGKWPPHRYYERLHDLLGQPSERIKSLKPSVPLWEQLETWSTRYLNGQLGCFRTGFVGSQEYVGIPRIQVLLASREHHALEQSFLRARLTPTSDPSDRRLHAVARGSDGLLSRTRNLLADWPTDHASRALLEEIRAHLEAWEMGDAVSTEPTKRLSIPLLLELRSQGRSITSARLVTESVSGLTDSDRSLVRHPSDEDGDDSAAYHITAGESTSVNPVLVDEFGDPHWAMREDWFADMQFSVAGSPASISRRAAAYIVLGPGMRPASLIQRSFDDLEADHPYLLLAQSSREPTDTPSFVSEYVNEWTAVPFAPAVLYRAFRAAASEHNDLFTPRIRLVGGVASQAGRGAFFSFAPPDVAIELPLDQAHSIDLQLRATDLTGNALSGAIKIYGPSPEAPTASILQGANTSTLRGALEFPQDRCAHCHITATMDGTVEASKSFHIDHAPIDADIAHPPDRDALGQLVDHGAAVFRGLDVTSSLPESSTHLPLASRPIDESQTRPPSDVAAQRVMQLMRTRHRIPWTEAKRAIPGCLPRETSHCDTSRHLIHEIQTLHALGVLELEESEHGGVSGLVELPPRLVLLPRLANRTRNPRDGIWSAHQVITAGCWLPTQLGRLKVEARKLGIDLLETPRLDEHVIAPNYRLLLTSIERWVESFRQLALKLGVRFDEGPPLATRMASALSSIDTLDSSPRWVPGRPPQAFKTRYFHPKRIGVGREPPPDNDRYVLWECRHNNRPIWQFFIVDSESNRHLEVSDRQLGRWFVRRQVARDAPIPSVRHDILIPLELRLPVALERTLVLSSGHAPTLSRYEAHSPFIKRSVSECFLIPPPQDVPLDWFIFREECLGTFCRYRGVLDTAAWRKENPMPMLDTRTKTVADPDLR